MNMGPWSMGAAWLLPALFSLVWIAAVVYLIALASRLVTAVEQIARHLATRATTSGLPTP